MTAVLIVLLFVFLLAGFPLYIGLIVAPLVVAILYFPQLGLDMIMQQLMVPVFNILEKTCWVTPSTRNRRRATKPTAKTPNGFATCTCAAWSSPALSRRPTSASSEI